MSADDDGLILNLAFDPPSAPKAPSAKSLKKQYVIEGGTKYERQMLRRAIQTRNGKTPSEIKKDANETPLGRKRKFNTRDRGSRSDSKDHKKADEKKGDTSLAAQFRKKRKTEEEEPKKKVKVLYHEKRVGEDGNTFVSSLFSADAAKAQDNDEDDTEKILEDVAEPSNAPLKKNSFENLGVSENITETLYNKMKLSKPTKIQQAVLPRIINGDDNDLFIQAQTGSGKTLAFVLPIVERLNQQRAELIKQQKAPLDRQSGLFAVILAPTRELAAQIYSVLEIIQRSKGCNWLVPGIVSGGEKKKSEKARIRKGINILVATPGRLADHINSTENLTFGGLKWLVLDECDRLMELGFEETINKILKALDDAQRGSRGHRDYTLLPKRRVNVLCSATVKGKVKELGEKSLTDAEWITSDGITDDDDDAESSKNYRVPAQLIQKSVIVPAKLRLVTLAATLKNIVKLNAKQKEKKRVMVFFSCSDSVNFHFSVFGRSLNTEDEDDEENGKKEDETKEEEPVKKGQTKNFAEAKRGNKKHHSLTSATVANSPWLGPDSQLFKLHGSLDQPTRSSTLKEFFKSDKPVSILFCTDVASRGLDLPEITNVVEFDPPFSTDDHIHRVGRTARAGKNGTSVLFLLPDNEERYLDLIKDIHKPREIIPEKYERVLKMAFQEDVVNSSKGNLNWEIEATTWHLNIERWILTNDLVHGLAKKAFTSHIRAYTTHLAAEKEIFNLKELHLGHIAKSFGLRETPGKMNGKGNSSSATSKKGARSKNKHSLVKGRVVKSSSAFDSDDDYEANNNSDGKALFLARAKKIGASQNSEFNIG